MHKADCRQSSSAYINITELSSLPHIACVDSILRPIRSHTAGIDALVSVMDQLRCLMGAINTSGTIPQLFSAFMLERSLRVKSLKVDLQLAPPVIQPRCQRCHKRFVWFILDGMAGIWSAAGKVLAGYLAVHE